MTSMTKQIRFLFFVFLSLISCESITSEEKQSEENRLKTMIAEMEEEFKELSEEVIWLEKYYQKILLNKDSLLRSADGSKYVFEGAFSNNSVEESDLSTIIISTKSSDPIKSFEEVLFTNSLDSAFISVYKKHGIIAQVYSNSSNQVSRVYPSYDAEHLMDPGIDLLSFNFYYEADQSHNPEKSFVWIPEVYVDPAGKGWIMSLICPVYEGEELFAVLGIDVTVDEILHRFLEKQDGNFLIVNGKGDIVSSEHMAIEALSFPPLKNHIYRETIRSDNFRVSDFNLFNSKSNQVREMAKEFILKKEKEFVFENESDLKTAIAEPFNFTDWYLIEINPE